MRSLDFKFQNLEKACMRLEEACITYNGKNDMIRDCMILRFKFTYELTHKTLQELMKYEGVTLENSFPRTIYKKAYASDLIKDEKLWINLLEDRNRTSHMYSESLADEIANSIKGRYVGAIKALVNEIRKYID